MAPALYLVTLLIALISFGFWLSGDPLMILGLLLIPSIIQAMPWMLAVAGQRDDDDEDGPPRIGFLGDPHGDD